MTDSQEMTAYCMKCRTNRPMQEAQPVFAKNGRPATQGKCVVCGTTLYKMGETPAHAGMPRPEPAPKEPKPAKKSKAAGSTKGKQASAAGGQKKARASKTRAKAADDKPQRRSGRLVIVESPAKAKTIENYLGKDYRVRASVGHIRDLLRSQLSVDVENAFAPKYRVPNDKRSVVKDLQSAVNRAEEIYLATDPDREGEAIAWHLTEAVNMGDVPVHRVVFYEITRDAVQDAFRQPRQIDMNLVDAQQARRILDRLVGYELSPLLWEKVRPRLSAGRVQSVAVRLIVEREREIQNFVPEEYWTIDAELARSAERDKRKRQTFIARLIKMRDQQAELHSQAEVEPVLEDLRRSTYVVEDIKRGQRKRTAAPPFTTSTLQQEASRRLGFTARRTMSVAQQLYEGINLGGEHVGLITYMRTDSTNVSGQARAQAADYIRQHYGAEYVPAKPNFYASRAKNAQEAHEAIRPTSVFRTPPQLQGTLNRDQLRLYTLIWQRFVASQMAAAVYDTLRVDISAGPEGALNGGRPYLLRATGSTLRFPGFLAVYADHNDEDNPADEDLNRIFPELSVQDLLDLIKLLPQQHFTQPPPRYTEASLVKALEEYGIGRPSTYAPIMNTIQERGYVERDGKRLMPTETGFVVNDLLVEHFEGVVDLGFTARMEDALDDISNGEQSWVPVIDAFYKPFHQNVDWAHAHLPNIQLESDRLGRDCPNCGSHDSLVIRYGKFGKFIACSNFPECRYTEPWLERLGIACPVDGGEIVERKTRRGRTFYGCSNYPECSWTSWKRPLPDPCPHCGGLLIEQNKNWAQCSQCERQVRVSGLPSVKERRAAEAESA